MADPAPIDPPATGDATPDVIVAGVGALVAGVGALLPWLGGLTSSSTWNSRLSGVRFWRTSADGKAVLGLAAASIVLAVVARLGIPPRPVAQALTAIGGALVTLGFVGGFDVRYAVYGSTTPIGIGVLIVPIGGLLVLVAGVKFRG